MRFHCARCDKEIEPSRYATSTWCPSCGTGYRVGPEVLDDGSQGVGVTPLRTIEQTTNYNARCQYCGEPYNADGYPALLLFRMPECQPGLWHVFETTVLCTVCSAPLPVTPDKSLTPKWAERMEAE